MGWGVLYTPLALSHLQIGGVCPVLGVLYGEKSTPPFKMGVVDLKDPSSYNNDVGGEGGGWFRPIPLSFGFHSGLRPLNQPCPLKWLVDLRGWGCYNNNVMGAREH